jgi:hypothetical protein
LHRICPLSGVERTRKLTDNWTAPVGEHDRAAGLDDRWVLRGHDVRAQVKFARRESYWRLPDRLYDDADELAQWARHALKAAREVAAAKPRVGKKQMKTKR